MQTEIPHALCGAKTKTRDGGTCKNPPIAGMTRCRMHGGKSPKGIAAGNFKHGRYSSDMPARLLERYQVGIADPDLLNLRDGISLVDARLSDVLGRVDSGESGESWKQASEAYKLLRSGMRTDKKDDISTALLQLDAIINTGLADYDAWHEVGNLLEQRRRLVESEQKRLVAAQQMVTAEQAMTFVSAIIDSVKRNVQDRNALNAISLDISKLSSMSNGVDKI